MWGDSGRVGVVWGAGSVARQGACTGGGAQQASVGRVVTCRGPSESSLWHIC